MTFLKFFNYTALFIMISIGHVFAADYYVDAVNGNDSNSGTSPSAAWKTLSKVSSFSFKPGDNILLKSGQQFAGPLTLSSSGSSSAYITIASFGSGNRPVINGSSSGAGIRLDKRSYVIVKDLQIIGAKFGLNFIQTHHLTFENLFIDNSGWSGGYGDYADYIKVRNVVVQNSVAEHGIYFGGSSDYVIVENSIFRNNKKSGIHFNCDANATPSRNAVVRYNRIHGNKQYGINNTATRNSQFYYNLVYDNTTYGFQFEYDIHASGNATDSNKVYNNVFYNNSGPGVYIGSQMKGNIVKNNIFHQGSQTAYMVQDKSTGNANVFSNNIYFGTKNSSLWVKNNTLYSSYSSWASASNEKNSFGGNTSASDPLFTNAAAYEFTLKSGSPAAGKGTNVGLSRDFNGSSVSSTPDIGAYQLSSAPADNTPPQLKSASASSNQLVVLTFSEKLNQSEAQNKSNYTVNNGITVSAASLSSAGTQVSLTVSTLAADANYTVSVKNIKDISGNLLSSSASSASFKTAGSSSAPVKLKVVSASASATAHPSYSADKTIDGKGFSADPHSRWGAEPMPSTLTYDLGSSQSVSQTKVSFFGYNTGRTYTYSVSLSSDAKSWKEVAKLTSDSKEWSTAAFTAQSARYIKLTFLSANDRTTWAKVYEVEVYGGSSANTQSIQLPISSVAASSTDNSAYPVSNTIDGKSFSDDPESRWAAQQFPSTLTFDLGSGKSVDKVSFSFFGFNTGRIYNYSVSVSSDNKTWTEVVKTPSKAQEWSTSEFPSRNARYVKLTFISANNTDKWANLYEAQIWGTETTNKTQGIEEETVRPVEFELAQNYPNPFNPVTKINFSIPSEQNVTLKVYDILGKEVAVLVNENYAPGSYSVSFDAASFASGVYIYRLNAGNLVLTKKMILQK